MQVEFIQSVAKDLLKCLKLTHRSMLEVQISEFFKGFRGKKPGFHRAQYRVFSLAGIVLQ